MKIHCDTYLAAPDAKFKLSRFKTTSGKKPPESEALREMLINQSERIAALQNRLFAENKQALLIILQGMDSAGKDSAIKSIMSAANPQGVLVHSFKHPSALELKHDYLWRHYLMLPEQGQITIFNRSHYENVLISKVHPSIILAERIPGIDHENKIDKKFWRTRYEQINDFEKIIIQNGTHILKFFLHLSKEEQCKRFLERIENKQKHWKFSSADIQERAYWDDYQQAYQDAINHTSTDLAPWHVIPADDKWFTHLLIGKIILEKLEKINPQFPQPDKEEEDLMAAARIQLLHEKRNP